MALTAETRKAELIESLASQVRGKLSGDKAGAAEAFVRQYYAYVPPDDILNTEPDDLYGAALSIWNFGRKHKIGDSDINRNWLAREQRSGWEFE